MCWLRQATSTTKRKYNFQDQLAQDQFVEARKVLVSEWCVAESEQKEKKTCRHFLFFFFSACSSVLCQNDPVRQKITSVSFSFWKKGCKAGSPHACPSCFLSLACHSSSRKLRWLLGPLTFHLFPHRLCVGSFSSHYNCQEQESNSHV